MTIAMGYASDLVPDVCVAVDRVVGGGKRGLGLGEMEERHAPMPSKDPPMGKDGHFSSVDMVVFSIDT